MALAEVLVFIAKNPAFESLRETCIKAYSPMNTLKDFRALDQWIPREIQNRGEVIKLLAKTMESME